LATKVPSEVEDTPHTKGICIMITSIRVPASLLVAICLAVGRPTGTAFAEENTDKKPSAAAPAAKSKSASKVTKPFSDKAKSGAPCEFLGPCGKCDCPQSQNSGKAETKNIRSK